MDALFILFSDLMEMTDFITAQEIGSIEFICFLSIHLMREDSYLGRVQHLLHGIAQSS